MFSNEALSRSQFCFNPLQNYRRESLASSDVCYWKLAKSVNNFRSKKRTAFEKNRLFGFQAGVGGPWFESRRGQNFFNLIFVVFSNDSYYTKKMKYRKWLNILLTPWCSCFQLEFPWFAFIFACLCIYYLFVCLLINLFNYFVCLIVYCLSHFLCVRLSFSLFIVLFDSFFVCLFIFICLFDVCLFARLFVCLLCFTLLSFQLLSESYESTKTHICVCNTFYFWIVSL